MNLEQNSGTIVIATRYDASSARTTVSARALNRYRLTPYRKVTGKKTTAVVRVEAKTGSATSLAPFSAASIELSPKSMRRKMFSSTTTESSINREKARASPPTDIELIDPPPKCRAMKATSAESGIERKTA